MNEIRLFLELFSRLLLRHCFESLRSTQVAMVHCSAQTSPVHVLQKLQQTCMVISSNTGRVYRPKDCERLILYLKDINLPKPDKWGTSQLIAFIQQVCIQHISLVSNPLPWWLDRLQPPENAWRNSFVQKHWCKFQVSRRANFARPSRFPRPGSNLSTSKLCQNAALK